MVTQSEKEKNLATDDKSKTTVATKELDISQVMTDEDLPDKNANYDEFDIIDSSEKQSTGQTNSNVLGMITGFLRKNVWAEKVDASQNVLDE